MRKRKPAQETEQDTGYFNAGRVLDDPELTPEEREMLMEKYRELNEKYPGIISDMANPTEEVESLPNPFQIMNPIINEHQLKTNEIGPARSGAEYAYRLNKQNIGPVLSAEDYIRFLRGE